MDFRDQWADNPVYAFSTWRRHGALDRRLERSWLSAADAVVTATPAMAAHYARISGRADVETITNGYDAEDFRALERASPTRFTVTYVGTLGPGYDPRPFLAAWRMFLVRRGLDESYASCRFVGHRSRMDFTTAISGDDLLRRTVSFEDFVSHGEALRAMVQASVLLLLLRHDALTSKLFEYLGAAKPILAVAPPGELRAFLAQRSLGASFGPEDQGGIVAELERLYDRRGADPEPPRAIEEFERRRLTETLAGVLDGVAAR
jgi:glycosyltransferase involved in cell wall biosynthesis